MSLKDTCISPWEVFPVELTAGASLTGTINLAGLRLFGLIMPADWTTADLTFQMSPDAGMTWANMLDQNGSEILSVGTPNSYITINKASDFAPLQYLRIRSGSSSSPVTQTASRVLQLVLRSV